MTPVWRIGIVLSCMFLTSTCISGTGIASQFCISIYIASIHIVFMGLTPCTKINIYIMNTALRYVTILLCQTYQQTLDKVCETEQMCIIISLYKRHVYTLWVRTCRHKGKYKVITIREDLTHGGLNKIRSFCRWHLQMYKFDWNFT